MAERKREYEDWIWRLDLCVRSYSLLRYACCSSAGKPGRTNGSNEPVEKDRPGVRIHRLFDASAAMCAQLDPHDRHVRPFVSGSVHAGEAAGNRSFLFSPRELRARFGTELAPAIRTTMGSTDHVARGTQLIFPLRATRFRMDTLHAEAGFLFRAPSLDSVTATNRENRAYTIASFARLRKSKNIAIMLL